MRKLQALSNKISNNKQLMFLLLIGGLYSLGIFLSNTFVNVYLWKQSEDYKTIAIYNLAVYIFQPLAFIVAGKLAKKIDRVIVLRLGIVFLSLFFLSVLGLGEKAAIFSFLLGSLLGIGYGFYWLAFNVLTFEITEPDTRDFFNGFLGILESVGGMIAPLVAGLIIIKMSADTGYTIIFSLSFILFICAVSCSFLIKRRHADGAFQFAEVWSERRKNKNWNSILFAHVFQGLREGIYVFIITIWIFLITDSEFSLGVFNLVLSGMSLISYFIATKYIKPTMRKNTILYGSILLYFSIFIIIYPIYDLQLFIYAVVIGIAYPIIRIPYVSLTYDVIGMAPKVTELRIEYIVIREIFSNIGRIISIGIFIIALYFFPAEKLIPILLLIFGTGYGFIYLFIKDIDLISINSDEAGASEAVTDEKNR